MTDTPDKTQANGGPERSTDDSDSAHLPELDFDLPEDTIFTEDDYQKMHRVVSHPLCSEVMHVLQENERLSASEISDIVDKETNDLHDHLRQLKQTALIRNQRGPRSGTDKPYSYYTLTSLGEVVLMEGLADGVQKLAAQEHGIQDRYSD